MFFVYVYAHPQTHLPFYVGKGTGDRDLYHWRNRKSHNNDQLRFILHDIHQSGQRPMITRVLETLDETAAYNEEKRLIKSMVALISEQVRYAIRPPVEKDLETQEPSGQTDSGQNENAHMKTPM